jgi:osmoprotectant transport system permease protein
MSFFRFLLQNRGQVLELTTEHLWLVGLSTLFATLIGIPLGILIAHWPRFNKPVLGGANIIQTVPSLALFGFLLPVPWLGARADRLAILALTLYALLPIIRNTFAGIRGVDAAVIESGRGMGMTESQLLFQVELPLASSVILSGVRTAVVISVGLATIAAAIGADWRWSTIRSFLRELFPQRFWRCLPISALACWKGACNRDELEGKIAAGMAGGVSFSDPYFCDLSFSDLSYSDLFVV